jgi:hypothetical protein
LKLWSLTKEALHRLKQEAIASWCEKKEHMLLWTIIIIIAFFGLVNLVDDKKYEEFGIFLIIIAITLSFISGWGRTDWRWGLDNGVLYRVEFVRVYQSGIGPLPARELLLKRESDGKLILVAIEHEDKENFVVGKLYVADGYLCFKNLKPAPEK